MRWEWDDDGDDRVSRLWHLRAELSTTRKAVYTKWFRGKATYFSRPVFEAMLRALNPGGFEAGLSEDARRLLRILEGESPLSTKELKRQADLPGRANEAAYTRALRELWSRLLIVAYGEVDDGAFPSLAIGSTRVIFEELWERASTLDSKAALRRLAERLPKGSLFLGHFEKLRRAAHEPARARKRVIPSVIRYEDTL